MAYTCDMARQARPYRSDERARRRRQGRRRLALCALLAALVLVAVIVALARGGDERLSQQAAASPPPPSPPPVWAASPARPVRVWSGGDSLGGELGIALGPMLDEHPGFTEALSYKESSGICRWDFFDWGGQMRAVMRQTRPKAMVMMIGTNDTQDVWDHGTWVHYGTSEWRKAYEGRVGSLMDTMLKGGARRVYWVGMPVMSEQWRNPRMELINQMIERQAGKRPGVRYVDAWSLFAGPGGAYLPRWRAADGVHFTAEGQQRLASKVYGLLARDWLPPSGASPSPST